MGGHHVDAALGHRHANHVALQRQLRMVARGPKVLAVDHGHGAHAASLGLFHGQRHGLWPDGQPQAVVAIDGGHSWGISKYLHDRGGIHRPLL